MTLTDLYLFMVLLPNMHSFASGPIAMIPIVLLVGGAMGMMIGVIEREEKVKQIGVKSIRWGGSLLALLCCLSVFTPSHTQLYAIAGGYVATNTKDIEKLPENLVGAANAWLKNAADLAETVETESKPKKKQ